MRRKVLSLFWLSALVFLSYSVPLSTSARAEDSKVLPSAQLKSAKGQKRQVPKKVATTKLSRPLSEANAVAIVSARPEVKKFLLGIKNSKIKGVASHIEFDRKEGTDLVVHVYEYVPDDFESGHTATFNWYHVNSATGKVNAEF